MTDPQPLYSDGTLVKNPELAGRHLRVTEVGDGRARLADPTDGDRWLEIDADAVMEVGRR